MKLETAKSLILIVLIGISLLLTYGLWSYQPSGDTLENSTYENETDLGGDKESKKSLIEPHSVIFHADSNYYGFSDPLKQKDLYAEMQSWVMDNFETGPPENVREKNYFVEITFPDELPMTILNGLFNFSNQEITLPSWKFKQIYFTFSPETASLKVHFVSVNGQQHATAFVNDSANYERLWSFIADIDADVLKKYTLFNEENTRIYVPADHTELAEYSFTVNKIDPNLLINALFRNPSAVRPIFSGNERLYTDNQQQIQVFENGSSMEFYNPYSDDHELTDTLNLIDRSIMNINDHYGWTEEFNLLSAVSNTIRYQMYYEGYPVFDNSHLNLNVIEQKWINQDLAVYRRPLFTLEASNILLKTAVELPAGDDIIDYLQHNKNSNYNVENIKDLRIGYRLELDGIDITLVPAWYMNYNGSWVEFKYKDLTVSEGGI